jgi:DUF1680 family protein
MNKLILLTVAAGVSVLGQSYKKQGPLADYPISMAEINKVEITDSFWLPKIKTVQDVTIAFAFDKCKNEGRFDNFLIAGGKKQGKTNGKMPFDDTDVYKTIEGASYSLVSAPNPQLEAYLDSIIAIIQIGQEPDGYLTTWITIDPNTVPASWVEKTGKRWLGERSSHELYNAGHMYEAAVAHYLATGKRNFLDIAIKNADLLVNTFGSGKITAPPGHQIVETGLVKLYRVTHNENYLKLAKYFLDLRGDASTHSLYGAYNQDHLPVTQQTAVVGHAVRGVYMYAGMTDIATLYADKAYMTAVETLWNNMVSRKMALTGGIGARHDGESFGDDYELPNLTSYNETCAAIGDVYWNNRLFMLSGDAKYFDVIERSLYNGLISGISLDGKSFFYVNPLESDGKFLYNQGFATRQPWFDCSCCPTNLVRFIPSMPGLIYASQGNKLYINLYASNKAEVKVGNSAVKISQETSYPWAGEVKLTVHPQQVGEFALLLRIPGWARNQVLPSDLYAYTNNLRGKVTVKVNGKTVAYSTEKGYAVLSRKWADGDVVTLSLPMEVRQVRANEKVADDKNKLALEYGPIVYCVEDKDNSGSVSKVTLSSQTSYSVSKRNGFLGGVNVIKGNDSKTKASFVAIPYYAWSNRGVGEMKVWLPAN